MLDRDLLELGLQRGDLGAVVQVYEPDGFDVEVVSSSGRTEALLALRATSAHFHAACSPSRWPPGPWIEDPCCG